MQEPSHTDLDVLATLLQHADAVVSNAGTVLLDALVNDRPAVCVLYDEGAPAGRVVGGEERRSASTTATWRPPARSTRRGRSTRSSPVSSGAWSDPASSRRSGAPSPRPSSARSTAERGARRRGDRRRGGGVSTRSSSGSTVGKAGRTQSGDRARAEGGLDDRLRALRRHRAGARASRSARGREKRLENLNGLVELAGGLAFVVLCDDDVEFVRGDVVELVEECAAAGFGLGQPAHAPGSEVSHRTRGSAPRSRSREVPFVESGPISVISPELERARPAAPGLARDGLGARARLDATCRAEGCRLGIVDAVHDQAPREGRRHVRRDRERGADASRSSRRAGLADWGPLPRTLATWRPWRRRPRGCS